MTIIIINQQSLNCSTWEWSHIVALQRFNTKAVTQRKSRKVSNNNNNNNNNNNIGRTVREQITFDSMIKLPCKRSSHTAVVLPSYRKMLIYGGRSSSETLGDLWAFDLDEYQWDNIQIDNYKSLIPPFPYQSNGGLPIFLVFWTSHQSYRHNPQKY